MKIEVCRFESVFIGFHICLHVSREKYIKIKLTLVKRTRCTINIIGHLIQGNLRTYKCIVYGPSETNQP